MKRPTAISRPGKVWAVMCRVFGCVWGEPASIRQELVEARNPLIRQSEEHDSGWGMAVYQRADGLDPKVVRFPEAAYHDGEFLPATELRGRIFNVHVRRATMGGLNFLFSDGDRLFAYRLGLFELHWLHRPGQLLVASEKVTDEPWHTVQQDVLLVLDPDDLEEPHAERLIGDELLAQAEIRRIDAAPHLRGEARGRVAAERARAAVADE